MKKKEKSFFSTWLQLTIIVGVVVGCFATPCSYADLWIIDSEQNPDLPDFKHKTLFISLGSHCFTAGLLRDSGLRKAAFPLDWVISLDNEGVIKALEEDFDDFLNDAHLVPDSVYIPAANGASLVHSNYHLEFVHEGHFGGADAQANREAMHHRYQRRIERFRKLADYPGTVIFLRSCFRGGLTDNNRCFKYKEVIDISDEDSLKLHAALKKRFPKLNYKLVIMNEAEPPLHGIIVEKELSNSLIKVRHYLPTEKELYSEYKKFFYSVFLGEEI